MIFRHRRLYFSINNKQIRTFEYVYIARLDHNRWPKAAIKIGTNSVQNMNFHMPLYAAHQRATTQHRNQIICGWIIQNALIFIQQIYAYILNICELRTLVKCDARANEHVNVRLRKSSSTSFECARDRGMTTAEADSNGVLLVLDSSVDDFRTFRHKTESRCIWKACSYDCIQNDPILPITMSLPEPEHVYVYICM